MDKNIPETNLKELFTEPIFQVPIYQRPYSWDEDKVEELWDDLIYTLEKNIETNKAPDQLEFNESHFIGMFIFSESESKSEKKNVIDGQQRLTTLLILLSIIKSKLENFSKDRVDCKELSKKINQDFLSKTNDEGKRI